MADSQVPRGVDALGGPVTDPAWRTKPKRPKSRSGETVLPLPEWCVILLGRGRKIKISVKVVVLLPCVV
jgi:hypothetical protein